MSNSDYTLLEFALRLGGHLRRSVDLETGEVLARADFCEASEGSAETAARASTLSTAHIRPFIEYRAGASLLRACRGGETEQIGGGQRGAISGFSFASRRRLMFTIGAIRQDADLPAFVTLTYPDKFPEPGQSKRHLKMFFQRMRRSFAHGSIWKLEPQERGAPHYHLLTWGCDLEELRSFVPGAWFDIAGGGDNLHLLWHMGKLGNGNCHCVQPVRTWRGVWSYASKYLGKTFEVSGWGEKWTGRFWGVVNRDNVPFGDLVIEEVARKKAVEVIRYQRRFSGQKHNKRSMSIFCDADQWIENLLGKEVNE